MRILVACECSGTVRDAFLVRGHDAWSCDLVDSDKPGPHIRGDVRKVVQRPWDLMIAHPPCQFLSVSGMHWTTRGLRPRHLTDDALALVYDLMQAPIPRICVENPIGIISTRIRKPDQIVQPWMFGHPDSKATCLWLKGLPLLIPTDILPKPPGGRWSNQTPSGQNKLGPSPKRAKIRATTYPGIANAMADQWTMAGEREGEIEDTHPDARDVRAAARWRRVGNIDQKARVSSLFTRPW